MNEYSISKDPSVKQVSASFIGEKKSIEILRFLEHGYNVIAQKINTPFLDVNYSSDIKKIESFLRSK